MTRATARVGIILGVLALGIALKVNRYASPPDTEKSATLARIGQTMQAHGWRPAPAPEPAGATLYEYFEFRHDGCPNPVIVAVMTGNAEAAEFMKLQYRGDLVFINGQTVGRPSGFKRQLNVLQYVVKTVMGGQPHAVPPLLAITPAPDAEASGCLGPPLTAWTGPVAEAGLQKNIN